MFTRTLTGQAFSPIGSVFIGIFDVLWHVKNIVGWCIELTVTSIQFAAGMLEPFIEENAYHMISQPFFVGSVPKLKEVPLSCGNVNLEMFGNR